MITRICSLLAVAAIALTALACEPLEDRNPDLTASTAAQDTVMERAIAAVPPYEPQSYPFREAINWYLEETERTDIWYVYLLSLEGRPIFYIVSDILPLSVCRSITSPQRIVNSRGTTEDHVMAAPSLTGTYGSANECQDYFARDAATGAFIKFAPGAASWIASSVPLTIETDLGRLGGTTE